MVQTHVICRLICILVMLYKEECRVSDARSPSRGLWTWHQRVGMQDHSGPWLLPSAHRWSCTLWSGLGRHYWTHHQRSNTSCQTLCWSNLKYIGARTLAFSKFWNLIPQLFGKETIGLQLARHLHPLHWQQAQLQQWPQPPMFAITWPSLLKSAQMMMHTQVSNVHFITSLAWAQLRLKSVLPTQMVQHTPQCCWLSMVPSMHTITVIHTLTRE